MSPATEVLLIDDSATFLKLVNDILKKEGIKVMVAKTIDRAFKILDKKSPKLILLDLRLNNEHGFNFLEKAKIDEKLKNIPVIVVSADYNPIVIKKAIELGANDYITKPLNMMDLRNKCKSHIRQVEVR